MSSKQIKEITQNIPNDELNAAYDALMNSSLNETSDYEEVSMEELNEYIEGLECQAEDLRKQLVKVNERVKELEKESLAFRSILDQSNRFHPNTDKMYSSGFKDAMRLFEDIYLGGAQQALNKFAIERKIEELIEFRGQLGCLDNREANLIANAVNRRIEQLRKEQE